MKAFLSRTLDSVKTWVRSEPVRVRGYVTMAVTAGVTALVQHGINVPTYAPALGAAAVVWALTELTRAKVRPSG